MSPQEIDQIAQRVVEYMREGSAKAPVDGACLVAAGPPRPVIDDKKVEGLSMHIQELIIKDCPTDEEQFVVLNRIRGRMAAYWDEQQSNSSVIVEGNNSRIHALGKFIELSMLR